MRGGGHSIAGPVGDRRRRAARPRAPCAGVHVDPDTQLAVVQGGALWADVDRETQAFGLVAPGGVVSDTGVAGLTLGGGYGWVRRKYGLSVDALVEAAGRVRRRSGAHGVGRVSPRPVLGAPRRRRELRRRDLVHVRAAARSARSSASRRRSTRSRRSPRSCAAGASTSTDAPDEVTSVVVTITFPANPEMPEAVHDRPVAIVGGVYAGDPEEGLRVMAPLRELGTPLFDMSGPTPFTAVQSGFDPLFPRDTLRAYWKSQYLDELSDAAIDVIAGRALDRPAPLTLVNTFHMGGAIAAVDPEATAFARALGAVHGLDRRHVDRRRPTTPTRSPGCARRGRTSRSSATAAVYLNFTGLADEDPGAGVDTAFGRNLDRLGGSRPRTTPTTSSASTTTSSRPDREPGWRRDDPWPVRRPGGRVSMRWRRSRAARATARRRRGRLRGARGAPRRRAAARRPDVRAHRLRRGRRRPGDLARAWSAASTPSRAAPRCGPGSSASSSTRRARARSATRGASRSRRSPTTTARPSSRPPSAPTAAGGARRRGSTADPETGLLSAELREHLLDAVDGLPATSER